MPVEHAGTESESDGGEGAVGGADDAAVGDHERESAVEAAVIPVGGTQLLGELVGGEWALGIQRANDLAHLVRHLPIARAFGAGLGGWNGHGAVLRK